VTTTSTPSYVDTVDELVAASKRRALAALDTGHVEIGGALAMFAATVRQLEEGSQQASTYAKYVIIGLPIIQDAICNSLCQLNILLEDDETFTKLVDGLTFNLLGATFVVNNHLANAEK
jgi:hypothetical protein